MKREYNGHFMFAFREYICIQHGTITCAIAAKVKCIICERLLPCGANFALVTLIFVTDLV